MANKRTRDEDRTALEQKVKERQADGENLEGEKNVRRLRKRLKRVQRKIRGKAARIAKAAGEKAKAA